MRGWPVSHDGYCRCTQWEKSLIEDVLKAWQQQATTLSTPTIKLLMDSDIVCAQDIILVERFVKKLIYADSARLFSKPIALTWVPSKWTQYWRNIWGTVESCIVPNPRKGSGRSRSQRICSVLCKMIIPSKLPVTEDELSTTTASTSMSCNPRLLLRFKLSIEYQWWDWGGWPLVRL